ncbi:Casein kinase I-2-like protein [Hordeum vulgare]|nr:Casein kinase I-2-like protein [Hordeum vulgare]
MATPSQFGMTNGSEAILNIPLSMNGGNDSLAWAFKRTCVYTVKSAYRVLMTLRERAALEEGTATETSATEKQMWNAAWKLNVVPKITDKDRAIIITIMWDIWHSQNRVKHDGEALDPVTTSRRMREVMATLELPRSEPAVLPGHGWRPPKQGIIKISTNGALNFAEGREGGGGVARTDKSQLAAWCKPHPGISDPFIMEALSVLEGVKFAKLRDFIHVIMETDCLEVVTLWNTCHNTCPIVAPILDEIGELVRDFILFEIQHVMRTTNIPAHLCAKRACNLNVTECWLDDTPSFLVTSLLAD